VEDTLELGRVTDRKPPFKYSALARVWFSDTDAQGIVYYGRYLPYFDHARVEYHRHLRSATFDRTRGVGSTEPPVSVGAGLAGAGGGSGELVMRAIDVEYHAPASFDDLIEAFVRVRRIGRTSMTYDCAAYRLPDDVLMTTASFTVVLVDLAARRPVPIPEDIRQIVRAFEGADLEE
jgi:acyl-CoA thioester hydrolase